MKGLHIIVIRASSEERQRRNHHNPLEACVTGYTCVLKGLSILSNAIPIEIFSRLLVLVALSTQGA